MMTAPQFADAIGRKNLADSLGVGATAISNAVVRGWFPASWFVACNDLAAQAGIDCPVDLFRMRQARHSVSDLEPCQGKFQTGEPE